MSDSEFYQLQLKNKRVLQSQQEKETAMWKLFELKNIDFENFDLFLRVIKSEQIVEVFIKNCNQETFQFLKKYDFNANSGILGPKRKSGDKQIPEGFYIIDKFNPESKFFLSCRINYPNKSDLFFGDKINPGHSIYIHGGQSSEGCICIGDENMKELYLLIAKSYKVDEPTKMHIFPFRFEQNLLNIYAEKQPEHLEFWENLSESFHYFEKKQKVPNFLIDKSGKYSFC